MLAWSEDGPRSGIDVAVRVVMPGSASRAAIGALFIGFIAAFVVACSSSEDVPASFDVTEGESKDAILTVQLEGDRITILDDDGADDDDEPNRSLAPDARPLAWELADEQGVIVASGAVADPRGARAEFDEQGKGHGGSLEATSGMFTVMVPNVDGELRVFPAPGQKTPVAAAKRKKTKNKKAPLTGEDKALGISSLSYVGRCGREVNLLVASEGYTDMALFHSDAQKLTSELQVIKGYAENWGQINVWAIDIPSASDGIYDPDVPTDAKTTAFNTAFYGDNKDASWPRRCVFPRKSAPLPRTTASLLARAQRRTRAQTVLVLVNEKEHGGCASVDHGIVYATTTNQMSAVMAHEVGHGLFILGDEYGYGTCRKDEAERWPNLTTSAASPKWSALVNTTELPTRTLDPSTIGAYPGGNSCDGVSPGQEVFHAQARCLMNTLDADFCAVCMTRVRATFEAKAERSAKKKNRPSACKTGKGKGSGGGSSPSPAPDEGSTDSTCVGKPDGVYCSPVSAPLAYQCEGGRTLNGLHCQPTQRCAGPNGPGPLVCE
jgi:hypothetical protein